MAQTPSGPGARGPQSGRASPPGGVSPPTTESPTKSHVESVGTSSPDVASSDSESAGRARMEQGGQRVREEAQRIGEEAKSHARDMVESQKGLFARELGGLAQALHKTAEQLGAQDQGPLAGYADRAASGLDRLSDSLQSRSGEHLLQQAQDFARRQPALFIGGAVAAGLMLSRFLKSSASHDGGGHAGITGDRDYGMNPGRPDEPQAKPAGMSPPSTSAHEAAKRDARGESAKRPGGSDEGR